MQIAGLKILIAHNYDSFSYARNSVALAKHLAGLGHQVFFLSHQPAPKFVFKPLDKLQVFSWPQRRPGGLGAIWFALKKLKRLDADAVIAHSAAVNPVIVAAYLLKIPVRIAYYHSAYAASGIDIQQSSLVKKILNWRKAKIYQLATAIIAVSRFAARDLEINFKYPAKKIHAIYNALPPAKPMNWVHASTVKEQSDKTIFCYVGRLDRGKGIADMLPPFFEANDGKHIHLSIAGSGTEENLVTDAAAKNELINYAGTLQYDRIPEFMAHADFLLYPTRAEAFGMVIIEAMAAQTIPIASFTGGIPEIIEDGINGFLVPGKLGKNWSEAINNAAELKKNKEAYQSIVKNGKETIRRKFSLERQIELISRLIHSSQSNENQTDVNAG